jgi:hypothetical protein
MRDLFSNLHTQACPVMLVFAIPEPCDITNFYWDDRLLSSSGCRMGSIEYESMSEIFSYLESLQPPGSTEGNAEWDCVCQPFEVHVEDGELP